jgi:hypothetical protein
VTNITGLFFLSHLRLPLSCEFRLVAGSYASLRRLGRPAGEDALAKAAAIPFAMANCAVVFHDPTAIKLGVEMSFVLTLWLAQVTACRGIAASLVGPRSLSRPYGSDQLTPSTLIGASLNLERSSATDPFSWRSKGTC